MTSRTEITTTSLRDARRDLRLLRKHAGSWHKVSRILGISTATLIRIVRDKHTPTSPRIRHILGLKRHTRRYHDLLDMPTALLAEMIRNRETVG